MKLKLADYEAIVANQKSKIEYLTNTINNYDSVQRGKCCDCCEEAIQDYLEIKSKLDLFEDDFFKGLKLEEIAELAKKSIRLTEDNCRMRHKLEDINEFISFENCDSFELKHIKKIIERNV